MKIDALIKELQAIRKREGNLECTVIHSTIPADPKPTGLSDVFITTADTLVVEKHPRLGTTVRITI
jgi:hypothetical protein